MGCGTAWGGRFLCTEDIQLGSIPRRSTIYIVPWCSGNITDFDSVVSGSNPGGTAIYLEGWQSLAYCASFEN